MNLLQRDLRENALGAFFLGTGLVGVTVYKEQPWSEDRAGTSKGCEGDWDLSLQFVLAFQGCQAFVDLSTATSSVKLLL